MELQEFFHMNKGDGELSYSQNSFVQKGVNLMGQPILESAIQSLISESVGRPSTALAVADMGCGVGPVPLALVSLVIQNVEKIWKSGEDCEVPEIVFHFNDLPSNDFNLLFRDLSDMKVFERKNGMPWCFFMTTPGSYYCRLFPKNSLHFVHANYTLHWLSKTPPKLMNEGVPINKGNIYISETSPTVVASIYLDQFQQDFTQFLKCRSEEVLPKGRMLLTFRGRSSSNAKASQPWELKIFNQAITYFVSQGLIKEEQLDAFDFPYYGPSKEEIQHIVENNGSFEVENMSSMTHHVAHEIENNYERSQFIGKFMRSFTESLVSRHFGEDVLDLLYDKFTELTSEHLANGGSAEHYTIIVLLKKY